MSKKIPTGNQTAAVPMKGMREKRAVRMAQKTGEEIPITARRVVTFHASQKLKSDVELACDGNAA